MICGSPNASQTLAYRLRPDAGGTERHGRAISSASARVPRRISQNTPLRSKMPAVSRSGKPYFGTTCPRYAHTESSMRSSLDVDNGSLAAHFQCGQEAVHPTSKERQAESATSAADELEAAARVVGVVAQHGAADEIGDARRGPLHRAIRCAGCARRRRMPRRSRDRLRSFARCARHRPDRSWRSPSSIWIQGARARPEASPPGRRSCRRACGGGARAQRRGSWPGLPRAISAAEPSRRAVVDENDFIRDHAAQRGLDLVQERQDIARLVVDGHHDRERRHIGH